MPIYEFRCNDTGNRFEVEFDSIKAYSDATITSPFNGSTNVTRVINRVNFTRIDNASNTIIEDTRNITKLGHQDPKALAYSLRKAVDESGGTGDDKFETVMKSFLKQPSRLFQMNVLKV